MAVLCDLDTLDTLPENAPGRRHGRSHQYGMIRDEKAVRNCWNSTTWKNAAALWTRSSPPALTSSVTWWEQDEFDIGERMILNFGIPGHAVESYYHYETYITAAAAAGMCMID